jgi:arylsulfatase A-like enzyme
MRRRDLLKAAGALPALALPAHGQAPAVSKGRRPNILFIVTDQQRHWLDLPSEVPLPGHQWLLERGRGFHQHHVHTTPCSPSRSNIYCGLHTQQTRMVSNHGAPPYPELAPVKTIGHLLREQGYYTAYKGKWHLSHIRDGANLGYGRYPTTRDDLEPYGFSDYNDDGDPHGVTWTGYKYDPQTAASAARWLLDKGKGMSGKRPWFLAVNFTNPHDVMYYDDVDGQGEKTRLIKDYLSPLSAPPVDELYGKDWDLPLPQSYYKDTLAGKPWAQTSYVEFCDMVYGRMAPDDEQRWRRYQSYYFNCIRDVDRHMLTVLRALERSGMAGDTLIVMTADHGEMAGAHRLRQKGPHMYRENIRVPLIVVDPDVKNAGGTDALSGAIDIVPTLLARAGLSAAQMQERYPALKGIDLSPVLADPHARTARDRRGILFNYSTWLYVDPVFVRAVMEAGPSWLGMLEASYKQRQLGPSLDNPGFFRGVHNGRYKFARYFAPGAHHTPEDWATLLRHNQLELYDTVEDPDELVNLAATPEKHRQLLLRLNAQTNSLIAAEVGEDRGAEHPGPTFRYTL